MTPAARLRRARRIIRQLWDIAHRTPAQDAELLWWERRELLLEGLCRCQ